MSPALLIGLSTLRVAAVTATPEATYLMPERFVAVPGAPVVVHLQKGTALAPGQPMPWTPDHVSWFFVRTTLTQENVAPDELVRVGESGVRVVVAEADAAVVGLDIACGLAHVGPGEALAIGGEPARAVASDRTVWLRRSARTVVRVAPAGAIWTPSPAAVSRTGQMAEIRPLMDPTMIRVGGDLPLRIYGPLGGAEVRFVARRLPDGPPQFVTSNAAGFARIRIDSAGPWLVAFHRYEADRTAQHYDGVLYSGTLTFEVRAEVGR